MRDPRDDKTSHFISFSKLLIFDLLMAIFSFFGVFVFALCGVCFLSLSWAVHCSSTGLFNSFFLGVSPVFFVFFATSGPETYVDRSPSFIFAL